MLIKDNNERNGVKPLEMLTRIREGAIRDYDEIRRRDNAVSSWGLARSRSSEESMYKIELKKINKLDSATPDNKKQWFYKTKLKARHDKYIKLINPSCFSFQEEKKIEILQKTPDIDYIEQIKRKLATKKIYISSKIIEPHLPFENIKANYFPNGGDMLIKFDRRS